MGVIRGGDFLSSILSRFESYSTRRLIRVFTVCLYHGSNTSMVYIDIFVLKQIYPIFSSILGYLLQSVIFIFTAGEMITKTNRQSVWY